MKTAAYKALMSLRQNNNQSGTYPAKSFNDIFGDSKTINTAGAVYSGGSPRFTGTLMNSGSYVRPAVASDGVIGDICLDIGSGNTAATENDYCLESVVTLGYSGKSVSTPIIDENNIVGCQHSVTYINNTGSDVTIRELGTYWKTYYNTSSGTSDWFLIERTVLDTPVVVPVNGNITVAFNMLY